MKKMVLSLLAVFFAASLTTTTHAQPTVQVSVDGISCTSLSVSPAGNQTQFWTSQFFGSPCSGVISIDSPGFDCDFLQLGFGFGSCPAVSAVISGTTDQLSLNNTVISNFDSVPHTIQITYENAFSNVNVNQSRFYGMSASGNFFRPPFDLASGDFFRMTSSVTYTRGNGGATVTEQIGGGIGSGATLQYPSNGGGLPAFGSVSLNDFSPQDPSQIVETVNCKLIGGGGNCDNSEKISTVLTVRLDAFDSLSLVGSAHNPTTNTIATLANILSSFTAVIDVKPGESENFVGPKDQGSLELALFGGDGSSESCYNAPGKNKNAPEQKVCITVPNFDISQVDLSSVVFGPNCPTGYNPDDPASGAPGCNAVLATSPPPKVQDVNGDGIVDLRLYFDNPAIGWDPDCANLSGTLVGMLTDGTQFSATSSVSCRP